MGIFIDSDDVGNAERIGDQLITVRQFVKAMDVMTVAYTKALKITDVEQVTDDFANAMFEEAAKMNDRVMRRILRKFSLTLMLRNTPFA